MKRWSSLTEPEKAEIIASARTMIRLGVKWGTIAKRVDVAYETLRANVDPEYREKHHAQMLAYQRRRYGRVRIELASAAAEARGPELPPADTRGLTARVAGDPLPGRSALDRRRGA